MSVCMAVKICIGGRLYRHSMWYVVHVCSGIAPGPWYVQHGRYHTTYQVPYLGLARIVHIHRISGDFPTINIVYTPYTYGSGQP